MNNKKAGLSSSSLVKDDSYISTLSVSVVSPVALKLEF